MAYTQPINDCAIDFAIVPHSWWQTRAVQRSRTPKRIYQWHLDISKIVVNAEKSWQYNALNNKKKTGKCHWHCVRYRITATQLRRFKKMNVGKEKRMPKIISHVIVSIGFDPVWACPSENIWIAVSPTTHNNP